VAFADFNFISSIGAFGMLLSPLIMLYVLRDSLKNGEKAAAVSWEGARGLEWTVASPAPHHTFQTPPKITDDMLAHGDVSH
jgi:cytochrome c oxidase subunit 1